MKSKSLLSYVKKREKRTEERWKLTFTTTWKEHFLRSFSNERSREEVIFRTLRRGVKRQITYFANVCIKRNKKFDPISYYKITDDMLLLAVKNVSFVFQILSPKKRNDRDFVMKCVLLNGGVMKYIYNNEFRTDDEIVMTALKSGCKGDLNPEKTVLEIVDEKYVKKREFVLTAVCQSGLSLRFACEKYRNDREIVMCAVKQIGTLLEFASDELKNDREIVYESVKRNGKSLQFASETLRNDREIVTTAVYNSSGMYDNVFSHASERLKDDREMVLSALEKDCYNICFVSERLKNDRDVVTYVVSRRGSFLRHVNRRFQDDKEIVLLSLSSCHDNNFYIMDILIGKELRKDRDFWLEVVNIKNGANVFHVCSPSLLESQELISRILSMNGLVLEKLPQRYKEMRSFVKLAVSNNGFSLQYAHDRFKTDRKIVLEAVRCSGRALSIVDKKFRKDRKIVLEAVRSDGLALEFACYPSEELRGGYMGYRRFMSSLNPGFKRDKKIVLEALRNNGNAYQWVDRSLKTDTDVICQAVETSGRCVLEKDWGVFRSEGIQSGILRRERVLMSCLRHNFLRKDVRNMIRLDERERLEFLDDNMHSEEEIKVGGSIIRIVLKKTSFDRKILLALKLFIFC